jgi:hypothetical protein
MIRSSALRPSMKASLLLFSLAIPPLAVHDAVGAPQQAAASNDPPLAGFPSTTKLPSAPCTCSAPKGMSGWCERHGLGYVGDVEIRSWLLYETMDAHGHLIAADHIQCPTCRAAYDSEGYCEEHKVGFVGKKAYFSRLTYELARAQYTDPTKISCPVCRKNSQGHGWCEKHQIGMVGNFAIKGKDRYQHAAKAIDILEIASKVSEHCEHCAMAIVTDSRCPFHKITYKDGHPVASPEAPPAAATGR